MWNDYVNALHNTDWGINLQMIGLIIAESHKKDLEDENITIKIDFLDRIVVIVWLRIDLQMQIKILPFNAAAETVYRSYQKKKIIWNLLPI